MTETPKRPWWRKKTGANKPVRKWLTRAAGAALFFLGVLSVPVVLILNPSLLYAHSTVHERFTVYHTTPLDPAFKGHLDKVARHLDQCELADPGLRIDICLNDGSKYPPLVNKLRGPAFGWSISNKIVLWGAVDWENNLSLLRGYQWNLEQLLTHEATHCLQINKLGMWRTTSFTFRGPTWKWEGYPEYVARQSPDQSDLVVNIRRLQEVERKGGHNGWTNFTDETGVIIPYYGYWLLVQYCLDVKKMTYEQLLEDGSSDAAIDAEMMRWYQAHAAKQ